jgi:S1-C subfamily serine protease
MKKLFSVRGVMIVAGICMFTGCRPVDVYEKYHKSVVMLYHTYLYQVTMGPNSWYFTYDKDKQTINEWNTNISEIKQPLASYGTGFFIDREGRIATNKHVVDDWFNTYELTVRNILRDWMQNNVLSYGHEKDSATQRISEWSAIRYDMNRTDEERDNAATQVEAWQKLQNEWANDQNYYDGLLSSLGEAKFKVVTLFLGYALDGTHTDNITDYKECVKMNISKDDNIDLAIIQTKDKRLPTDVNEPISLDDITSSGQVKVGEDVALMGYNWGPLIANSDKGLRVQKTDGKISQESDGIRVLYSIPSLAGSSGSPVFNKAGKLVAINYAGYSTTQSFNYGILAKYLKSLAVQ